MTFRLIYQRVKLLTIINTLIMHHSISKVREPLNTSLPLFLVAEALLVWSFGAPGHGKGTFDGVGGVLKNKIHNLIKGTKTAIANIAGTES